MGYSTCAASRNQCSISIEPMPHRVSRDVQGILDVVDDLSGRRHSSVPRNVVRKRETPILLIATRTTRVRNKMFGGASPETKATGEQRSHRFPDISLRSSLVVFHIIKMLPSPIYQLLWREGKTVDHALMWMSRWHWHTSGSTWCGVCWRWDGSRAGSDHVGDWKHKVGSWVKGNTSGIEWRPDSSTQVVTLWLCDNSSAFIKKYVRPDRAEQIIILNIELLIVPTKTKPLWLQKPLSASKADW